MKKKNFIKILIPLIIVVLIVFSLYFLFRRGLEKKKFMETLEEEKSYFLSSINPGDFFPLNEIETINGEKVEFNGKKTLLIITSPNCASCNFVSFLIKEWMEKYRNIQFVYIALDENIRNIQDINGVKIAIDKEGKILKNLNIYKNGFPSLFLISPERIIVYKSTNFISYFVWERLEKELRNFSEERFDQISFIEETPEISKKLKKSEFLIDINEKFIIPDDLEGNFTLIFYSYNRYLKFDNMRTYIDFIDKINFDINKLIILNNLDEYWYKKAMEFYEKYKPSILYEFLIRDKLLPENNKIEENKIKKYLIDMDYKIKLIPDRNWEFMFNYGNFNFLNTLIILDDIGTVLDVIPITENLYNFPFLKKYIENELNVLINKIS